jgi:hypothetical protein
MKFSFFVIQEGSEQKDTMTTTASVQAPSIQQKQVEKLKQSTKIPSAHSHLMQSDWLKRSNPSNIRFATTFHKPSNATSPARQATHQGSDSTNAFPSPMGTQRNGDHCFLRGRIDPDGYRWPPTYSNWLTCSFHHWQLFPRFLSPKLLGSF